MPLLPPVSSSSSACKALGQWRLQMIEQGTNLGASGAHKAAEEVNAPPRAILGHPAVSCVGARSRCLVSMHEVTAFGKLAL